MASYHPTASERIRKARYAAGISTSARCRYDYLRQLGLGRFEAVWLIAALRPGIRP